MLSQRGLIDVEDNIHNLNICDYETATIRFAEVQERTLGLVVIGMLPSSAGLIGWLALDTPLPRRAFWFHEELGSL